MNEGELTALLGEIAKLRAEVAAMTRVIGLIYEAGRDDAETRYQGGTWFNPAPARKPPRRDRGNLRLVVR